MHLMTEAGGSLTKPEAYQMALKAFYKRAAEIEQECDDIKKVQVEAQEAVFEATRKEIVLAGEEVPFDKLRVPGKPWSEAFLREEEEAIKISQAFADEMMRTYDYSLI